MTGSFSGNSGKDGLRKQVAELAGRIAPFFKQDGSFFSQVDHITDLYGAAYDDLENRSLLPDFAPTPKLFAESIEHVGNLIDMSSMFTPRYMLKYLRNYQDLIIDRETGEVNIPDNFHQTKIPLLVIHMAHALFREGKDFHKYAYNIGEFFSHEREDSGQTNTDMDAARSFNKLIFALDDYAQALKDLARSTPRGI